MKRKPYKTITLYNVIDHSIFIDDNKGEDWFPIDKKGTYFDWSDDLDAKLKEYNEIPFNSDDCGDSDGVEKILQCVEIKRKTWKKYKNKDDFHEYVVNEVNYNFTTLKSKYYTWQDLLSKEDLIEYKADLKRINDE